MSDTTIRLAIVLALGVLTWLIIAVGRAYIGWQRGRALKAAPLTGGTTPGQVKILAFSSDTCRQCHTHQMPALQRLLSMRPERVIVEEIDAPSNPELAERYHILTLPSTVVLDATGHAQSVNYGFANTQLLLKQVDALSA